VLGKASEAMTKSILYACPECSGQFAYLHHPNTNEDPAPRFCPLCGFDTQQEPLEYAVTSPALGNATAKSVDDVYREMEAGAAYRAALAGDPSLKMTNMQDHLRAGDISAPPINNAVTQVMAQQPNQWGFQPQTGLAQSQAAHTGYMPNAGLRALNSIRNQHSSVLQGSASSSLPALETQSPNYRPRL
jgi:hypothetical protein